MTDHHCRIKTVRLKHGYILDGAYARIPDWAYFKRIGYATWERISLSLYVKAMR